MDHQFQEKGKFALLTVNNAYTELPTEAFQLTDGTWVMPRIPVPDLGIWKEWLGSIEVKRLSDANLVLLVEEPAETPRVFDVVDQRLTHGLCSLFYMLHLHVGIDTADRWDVLCGSSRAGIPEIRQTNRMPAFYQSKGWESAPITQDWLEDSVGLHEGLTTLQANETEFRRVVRGLEVLFRGLRARNGQDRIHQFVRSLEALIRPQRGKTKKQFKRRCQTFARPGEDTRALLVEAYDIRSATEHLNPWDVALTGHEPSEREDVAWQRTRQMERLACDAYSRLLRDSDLREHFQTEIAMEAFWSLPDPERRELWGAPLDITQEH